MSLFRGKAEQKLIDKGLDPARLPPGQYLTEKWPVLDARTVPQTDLATWNFKVAGEVEEPVTLTYDELQALPQSEITVDIHCVTRWSRFDTSFRGVHWRELAALVRPKPSARFVLAQAEQGFTANQVVVDAEHPVDVGAEVRVRVEDVGAVGELALQLRVPLLHQLLGTLQRVVHGLSLCAPLLATPIGSRRAGCPDPWRYDAVAGAAARGAGAGSGRVHLRGEGRAARGRSPLARDPARPRRRAAARDHAARTAGDGRALRTGNEGLGDRARDLVARLPRARDRARCRPAVVPGWSRRLPACQRNRDHGGARPVQRPAARQERDRDRRHPARAACLRGGTRRRS